MPAAFDLKGHGHRPTAAEQGAIEREVARLGAYYDWLADCHVTITVPYRRANGEPAAWSFRLGLVVPDGELAIARTAKSTFEAALQDAFAAAGQQLEDYLRHRRSVGAA